MIVSDPPSEILDPQQPYWPADKVSDRIWLRLKGKLTGRPIAELSGERHTSYVNLSEADADRLIKNIKKYGKYPQVNQNDKYGGAYNNELYQKWLVEEFLEKPFQQQTNQKIEDTAIESRLKEIQQQREEKKKKAQSFVSSATSFRPGEKVKLNVTQMQGIIPKRSIPKEVASKISTNVETPSVESEESSVDFGRLLLNFVQINNDLDAIKEVIEEDFKTTKEKNKQEADEYKKRIANRGRKITRKELGNDKKSVVETVKPFISNFFSGAGGGIRSLALLKMLLGILNGDISAVFKGLFGIGLSFLPKIGMMIAGGLVKNLLASMTGRAVGGGIARGLGRTPMRRGPAAAPSMGFGKWAKIASLGAGALAIGSAFSADTSEQQQDNIQQESETQKRLEELTAQQKSSPEIGALPQEDLKKFQELNAKFEKALQFFIDIQKNRQQQTRPASGGGGGGGSTSLGNMSLMGGDASPEMKALMDTIASPESGGNYEAMYPSTTLPGATNMTISQVAQRATGPVGRYQHKPQFLEKRARAVGLDPATAKFSPENQDLITRGHITSVLGGDESKVVEQLKRDPSSVKRRLEGSTYTGLQKYGSDYNETFKTRKSQYETAPPAPTLPPPPVQPAPARSDGRRASALTGSPEVAVNIVPFSTSPKTGGGSFGNNGSQVANIDPNYSGDRFSLLTAGELNLIG